MSARYTSRGKGWAEIAQDARRILREASTIDPETGEATLTAQGLVGLRDLVDDWRHFSEPLAEALYEMMVSGEGRLIYRPQPEDAPKEH